MSKITVHRNIANSMLAILRFSIVWLKFIHFIYLTDSYKYIKKHNASWTRQYLNFRILGEYSRIHSFNNGGGGGIDWRIVWWIDWRIDWWINWWIDWWKNWWIDWLIYWWINWWMDWWIDWRIEGRKNELIMMNKMMT